LSRREGQPQFWLRVSENRFDPALPFGDELALGIPSGLNCRSWSEPDWQYQVTFNGFDRSAHVFFLVQLSCN
jgi:hypothetical protein